MLLKFFKTKIGKTVSFVGATLGGLSLLLTIALQYNELKDYWLTKHIEVIKHYDALYTTTWATEVPEGSLPTIIPDTDKYIALDIISKSGIISGTAYLSLSDIIYPVNQLFIQGKSRKEHATIFLYDYVLGKKTLFASAELEIITYPYDMPILKWKLQKGFFTFPNEATLHSININDVRKFPNMNQNYLDAIQEAAEETFKENNHPKLKQEK